MFVFAGFGFGQSMEEKIKTFTDKRAYKISYDKFKDKTTVFFRAYFIDRTKNSKSAVKRITFGAGFSFTGQKLENVDEFIFVFESYENKWSFLDNYSLIFLVDGNKITFKGNRNGEISRFGNTVTETLTYSVSRKDFEVIANSKVSEFQLANFEAELKDKPKQMVKNMLALATP